MRGCLRNLIKLKLISTLIKIKQNSNKHYQISQFSLKVEMDLISQVEDRAFNYPTTTY